MQYQIISAHALSQLEAMVNNEMRHDWLATGGLIAFEELNMNSGTAVQPTRTYFAQAMIRSTPQPKLA
jgi:hypothetical protein